MKPPVTRLWRVAALAALSWAPIGHAELIHRYSFTANANDSVGTAHGTAMQTSTGGTPNGAPVVFADGTATLDGVGGYIDLPNGIVSSNVNLTVEMWAQWSYSGGVWQRMFDFGVGSGGEDTTGGIAAGNGVSYLFFAPAAGNVSAYPRFTINGGNGENPVLGSSVFLTGLMDHIVIVYSTNAARLFINGVQAAIGETSIPLSSVNDLNNWLGRSNYGGDAMFGGSYDEVRILSHALTAPEIMASYMGGANAVGYNAGTLSTLSMTAETSMLRGQIQTPTIVGEYTLAGPVQLAGPDVTLTTSNDEVIEVSKAGVLKAVGAGSATITAATAGKTATVTISVAANAPQLMNRYSFSEAQGVTTITDSVGGQNGTVILGTNPPVQSGSALTLNGANNYANASYVDLPNGVISSRVNASIETWFTWNGTASETWTRVFDIGSSGKGDYATNSGSGTEAWWFSPRTSDGVYAFDVADGSQGVRVNGDQLLPAGRQHHLVCIFAPANQTSKLYLNGRLIRTGAAPFPLSNLADNNVWLGAANWNDPPFRGSFNEFRIWEGEMSDLDIAISAKAGPDAVPVAPGTLQSVSLNPIAAAFIGNLGGAQATFIGNFQNVTGVDITGLSGVAFSSSDTNVFATTATGAITPRNIGVANLIASYKGRSATTSVSILAPVAIRQEGLSTNLFSGSLSFTSDLKADYNGTNNVTATTFAGVTRSSSDTNVLTISNAGIVTPRQTGIAVVTAVYRWVTGTTTNAHTNQITATVVAPPGFTKGTLIHRYSFNGAADSTVVTDSVGTAHGEVVASTGNNFTGNGELVLPGGGFDSGAPYVNLPNGLLSALPSFTMETWVTWQGPADSSWQRIWDIGRTSSPNEDTYLNPGLSYTFLSPRSGDNTLRFAIKQGDGAELPQLNNSPLIPGAKTHIAVVYDTTQKVARMYVNGIQVANGVVTHPVSVLEDVNVYLGRSNWTDSLFNGSYDEFRIYNGPLLDADVAANFAAGPDTIGSGPAPTISVGKVGSNIEITWPESATGYVLQYVNQLGGTWAPANVTTTTSGGVVKATIPVPAGGTNAFFQLKK